MDWSDLVPDVLVQIARKLRAVEDLTALRGVCRSWRYSGVTFAHGCCKVPLLMLPGKGDEREFYSPYKRKVSMRMSIPEAAGKRCIYAGFGWTLTAPPLIPGELNLVRFSMKINEADKIRLPDFPGAGRYDYKQAVLSANPSETSDFVLLVLVAQNQLVFWRNGDPSWTDLTHKLGPHALLSSICYYKQKFHIFEHYAYLRVWDPSAADLNTLLYHPNNSDCFMMSYLVESSKGELLLVSRYMNLYGYPNPFKSSRVWKIDTDNRRCEPNKDLGGDAIFVGINSGVSVAASDFPDLLQPNCIYFTDDHTQTFAHHTKRGDVMNMGIYNVEDGCFTRFHVQSLYSICPPVWIFSSY